MKLFNVILIIFLLLSSCTTTYSEKSNHKKMTYTIRSGENTYILCMPKEDINKQKVQEIIHNKNILKVEYLDSNDFVQYLSVTTY